MAHLRATLIAPIDSAYIQKVTEDVTAVSSSMEINDYSQEAPNASSDLIIFLIHADRGISQHEIAAFNSLRERQIPALVLVSSLMPSLGIPLAEDRWDFDDIATLITRTMEKPVTPFLVLHDDDGFPIALYDLKEDRVINYTSGSPEAIDGDEELREIVREFKEEFDEEDYSAIDFTSGLRVVALPYIPERKIGSEEFRGLITMLQQAQP